MKRAFAVCFLTLISLTAGWAQVEPVVELVADSEGGWELLADGEPVFIKGMVWSTNPPGTNFNFNLWKEDEETIKAIVDRDAAMMEELGVNAVRCFSDVPPKWVEYLYDRYGIYTIFNDLFGRYGTTVNGRWYPVTDYANPAVRAGLVKNAVDVVRKYKDVRGVLMYLFGNENNYGLAWGAGAAIRDLDYGGANVQEEAARALYAAFEEAMSTAKKIDPNRPMGIVNGDVGWLDIIKEECVSLDVIGLNMYRGERAGQALYGQIKRALNKPIVYAEMGADAWNAKYKREDQYSQAQYTSSQWREILENTYGRGEGNALGGCVFEWTDEWWKHNPDSQEGLDVHDTDSDWAHEGYLYDFVPGQNNIDEEWFGITAQSNISIDGFPVRLPRAAFYALQHIWSFDPTFLRGGGGGMTSIPILISWIWPWRLSGAWRPLRKNTKIGKYQIILPLP
jgi:beta-galactosidase/beta-glucuronidase